MKDCSSFQSGSLSRVKNKTREDSWLFRYQEGMNGRRVHRNIRMGGLRELPTRKNAEKAVLAIRTRINTGVQVPESVAELVAHYKANELTADRKAFATADAHSSYLDLHILPVWGKTRITEVRTIKVEQRHVPWWCEGGVANRA